MLNRLITLLLIPCLIAEPSLAAISGNSTVLTTQGGYIPSDFPFEEQALMLKLVWRQAIGDRTAARVVHLIPAPAFGNSQELVMQGIYRWTESTVGPMANQADRQEV